MSMKISVSEKCVGCGLCMENEFIDEKTDGKARAAGSGVISAEQEEIARKVAEECPAKAIILSAVVSKEKDEVIKILDNKAQSLKLTLPPKTNYKFDAKDVYIELPFETGDEYDYKYSSYRQALDAGQNVIRKYMFGNRVGIVQDIIGNYLAENFTSYVDYNEVESNFYYAANCQAQKILDDMIGEVLAANPTADIAEGVKRIDTRPSRRIYDRGVATLSGGLLNAGNYIIGELSDSCYSLQSYTDYLDYDELDTYTTGAFGREKVVTKYCYRGVNDAYREIAKDIRSALGWSFEENVIDPAYMAVEYITETYQSELTEALKEKAERLKALL